MGPPALGPWPPSLLVFLGTAWLSPLPSVYTDKGTQGVSVALHLLQSAQLLGVRLLDAAQGISQNSTNGPDLPEPGLSHQWATPLLVLQDRELGRSPQAPELKKAVPRSPGVTAEVSDGFQVIQPLLLVLLPGLTTPRALAMRAGRGGCWPVLPAGAGVQPGEHSPSRLSCRGSRGLDPHIATSSVSLVTLSPLGIKRAWT